MQIKLNVNARRVTGRTKHEIVSKLRSTMVRGFGNRYTNALVSFKITGNEEQVVRVYNIEKRRKKVVRSEPNKKGKRTTKPISPNHWVGFYYDIPVAVLNFANLKVVQNNRNFDLVPHN